MTNVNTQLDYSEDLLEAQTDERILGAALLTFTTRDLVPDLLARIAPADFVDPHIGEIWESARAISSRGQSISKRTLLAERDTPGTRIRIEQLAGEPIRPASVSKAAQAVTEMAQSRRLIQVCKRIAQVTTSAQSYGEAFEFAYQQLAQLEGGQVQPDVQTLDAVTDTWLAWLDSPDADVRTFPTPWQELDDLLAGGLHAGRTYVVGGRPGDGKSIAGVNLAVYAAQRGHRSAIFSVEMGNVEVASRVYAAAAEVEYSQITKRNLDPFNRARLEAFVAAHRNMPLFLIDKSDVTIDYIAARCRALKRNGGLDVVFVDYLQLLKETDSKQARERQVAHISRSLKILARELDVAVIVACQLNRNAANAERKPTLSELRESGSIEQDADVVILLHHQIEDTLPTGYVDLIVAKNRTGKCHTVPLRWMGYQARLSA
ncbi:replicative DNA helicase [Rhodococcoides kyotonense]|uniref:Replicative DNA helicase n=1 Tax=Rhodococcoides kyotonense TaxID=398843 RepID=A0A239FMN7_9NOCA|nr:DnaB-like helicase C-terminal domain-containing protein [Rhodococcus kyotonensis]SNS57512.1 replicative DNA helicase [Rhodococcus kyotonensis]